MAEKIRHQGGRLAEVLGLEHPLGKKELLALMAMDADLAGKRLEPEAIRKQVVDTFHTLCAMMEPPTADMGVLMPIASRLAHCVADAIESGNSKQIEGEILSIRDAIGMQLD